MRIALVHSFYRQKMPSGENSAVDAQAAILRSAGHDVTLVSKHTDDEVRRPLYKITASLTAAGFSGPDPTSALQEFRPDVVHVHNLFPNWGGQWLKRWTGPKVATLHNFRSICSSGLLFRDGDPCTECIDASSRRAVQHRCYRDSKVATLPLAIATRSKGSHHPLLHDIDHLIVLNEFAQSVYAPLTDLPISVVPNFSTKSAMPQPVRAGFLYVGRLSAEKGPVELARRFPGWAHLKVIGDGPQANIIREIADSGNGNIEYLGGLSHGDTMKEIAQAQGVIVPSLCAEGMPTVALESMAHGTPIIVSDLCVSASELTRYGNGETYSPLDQTQLERVMKRISNSSRRYSEASFSIHAEKYSADRWTTVMARLYGDLVNQKFSKGVL